MARAKKIIRKSEREALKERRRSGEFKQDKKDARAAGLSRGDARKRAKRLSRVQALSKRKGMRADMAAKRNEDASVNKMFADRRRMEARRGGQELAYAIDKPLSPAEQREMAPGGVPPKKIKSGDKVSKEKGMYKIVCADGYVRYSQSEPEIIKRRKIQSLDLFIKLLHMKCFQNSCLRLPPRVLFHTQVQRESAKFILENACLH